MRAILTASFPVNSDHVVYKLPVYYTEMGDRSCCTKDADHVSCPPSRKCHLVKFTRNPQCRPVIWEMWPLWKICVQLDLQKKVDKTLMKGVTFLDCLRSEYLYRCSYSHLGNVTISINEFKLVAEGWLFLSEPSLMLKFFCLSCTIATGFFSMSFA